MSDPDRPRSAGRSDRPAGGIDWAAWNRRYDDAGDHLVGRLEEVTGQLLAALDGAPPGPLRLVSLCAGQGRDVLDSLARHPRGREVSALLVDSDGPSVAAGRERAAVAGVTGTSGGPGIAAGAGTPGVRFAQGDAGRAAAWTGAVPADVVVCCGVFGNLTDDGAAGLVAALPRLCAPGASVVWTRSRRTPDLVPDLCGWFADAGFAARSVTGPGRADCVGRHRLVGDPRPLDPSARLFDFVGYDVLSGRATTA